MSQQFKYPVRLLSSADSSKDEIPLLELVQGRNTVLDLWHTRCTRCPAALDQLNDEAAEHPEVQFIACALTLGEGDMERVQQMIVRWPNLQHVFLGEDAKERIKDEFSVTSVPYSIVVNEVKSNFKFCCIEPVHNFNIC